MASHNYKVLIAYDGTDFHGWQQQDNSHSIQALIRKAIEIHVNEPIPLIGSGRTDQGVHALGQVAHFQASKELSKSRFLYSLNGLLPPSIRILDLEQVSETFHAQHSAISKEYHYHLILEPFIPPTKRLYAWRPNQPLDINLLRLAAPDFIGTHDFTSFANKGSSSGDATRTLLRLDVLEEEGGLRLEFEGTGFLYKMVRNITGTLIAIAQKRLPENSVPSLFTARDRRLAPEGAPPHGLFLVNVHYPKY